MPNPTPTPVPTPAPTPAPRFSDMDPKPREGETPEQAQARATAAKNALTDPNPRPGESAAQVARRVQAAQSLSDSYAKAAPVLVPAEPTPVDPLLPAINAVESAAEKAPVRNAANYSEGDYRGPGTRTGAHAKPEEKAPEPAAESAYANRLALVEKYGSEAEQELQAGGVETFIDKMQQMKEENPLAFASGFGLAYVPMWAGTGWPASAISPEYQYTDRQWRALYEAQKRAVSLPTELNDDAVRTDSIFSNQDLYSFTVRSGQTAGGTYSAARAWEQLRDRYISNHETPETSAEELRALEARAGAWATDALLSARTFGGLNFPVEDLPTEKDERFTATWGDLFSGPTSLLEAARTRSLDPIYEAARRAPEAWDQVERALSPRVERLPGSEASVWRQEGPFDYLFRLEQIPLTVAKEAVVQGTITPELSDVLRGTSNMESFITATVESPDWQRDIQSNDPWVQSKAWLTLLAAGGIDVMFPTMIPLVGSATRFAKEIKLAQKVYREVLAAGETFDAASAARKAAAKLAAMRTAANELELVRELDAEWKGWWSGKKGSVLRDEYRLSEESLAATRAEKAAAAKREAKSQEVASQAADAFRTAEENPNPLAVADKISNKLIREDFLARVARALASDDNIAAFFDHVARDLDILPERAHAVGEIRALNGTEHVDAIKADISKKLEAARNAQKEAEAQIEAARESVKVLKQQASAGQFVGKDIQDIRDAVKPALKARLKAKSDVARLQKALVGADLYERSLAWSTEMEARRWLMVLDSGEEAVPSAMYEGTKNTSVQGELEMPTAPDAAVPGTKMTSDQLEIVSGLESVDDLLDVKKVGEENKKAIAAALLEGNIPEGANPVTVLERALEFSDKELDEMLTLLDEQVQKANELDPLGPLGVKANLPTEEEAASVIESILADTDATDEEIEDAVQAALLLPLLTKDSWNTLVSNAAIQQRTVRFGFHTADWTYRTAGEWYALPGAYLVSVNNEVLLPSASNRVWEQYLARKRYAVDNYLRASPDFSDYLGLAGRTIENPQHLDELLGQGILRAGNDGEAPTWNAYFRRQVAHYGARASDLGPEHVLTDDMVWVPNSPKASKALVNAARNGNPVLIPGVSQRGGLSGTRQAVLESTPPTTTLHQIPQSHDMVGATVKSGFAATVKSVDAEGNVTVELLTFSGRQGAPRPLPTGETVVLSAVELEFMERGRTLQDPSRPLGKKRPKTAQELAQVKGVQGVRYSGDSFAYLNDTYAPPINYVSQKEFRVYAGDLVKIFGGKDWVSRARAAGIERSRSVPLPRKVRFLPGIRQPGGGWASKVVEGERHMQSSAADSYRKGYLYVDPTERTRFGLPNVTIKENAEVPGTFGWKYKEVDIPLYRDLKAFADDVYRESLLGFDLARIQETGDDIPPALLDLLVERLSPHVRVAPESLPPDLRDRVIARGFQPMPRNEWEDALYSGTFLQTKGGDVLPISALFPRLPEGHAGLSDALRYQFQHTADQLEPDVYYAPFLKHIDDAAPQRLSNTSAYSVLQGLDNPQKQPPSLILATLNGLWSHMETWAKARNDFFDTETIRALYLAEMKNFAQKAKQDALASLNKFEGASRAVIAPMFQRTIDAADNILAATFPVSEKRAAFAEKKAQGAIHTERMLAAKKERAVRRVAAQEKGLLMPRVGKEEASDIAEQKALLDSLIQPVMRSNEIGRAALFAAVKDANLDKPTTLALNLIIDRLPDKVARSLVLQFFQETEGTPHGFTIPSFKSSLETKRLVTMIGLGVRNVQESAELAIVLAHEFTHALVPHLPPEMLKGLQEAYLRSMKRKGSLLGTFLRRTYKTDKGQKFEEWLAWVVSEYVTTRTLPEEATRTANKRLTVPARAIWQPLKEAFDIIRGASLNFVRRIIQGAGEKAEPEVLSLINAWYSPDEKVRAAFNRQLADIYADMRKEAERSAKEGRALEKEQKRLEREIAEAMKRGEKEDQYNPFLAGLLEDERQTKAHNRAMARLDAEIAKLREKAARDLEKAEKEAAKREDWLKERQEKEDRQLAQEARKQGTTIQAARHARYRTLYEEAVAEAEAEERARATAAGQKPVKVSRHRARVKAYQQLVKEELEAAEEVSKEFLPPVQGEDFAMLRPNERSPLADLRWAQVDATDLRTTLIAAKEARARVTSLFENSLRPALKDEQVLRELFEDRRGEVIKEALEAPERPSMYRPPVTPVESQVGDRVTTEMGRIGKFRDAPMTNTLLSRLAEGWAVQHGEDYQTADHALVKVLGRSWSHDDTWATVAADMLQRTHRGLEVSEADVIEALRKFDVGGAELLPAEVDHMQALVQAARNMPEPEDVNPDAVRVIDALLHETNWKSRDERFRVPGRHNLEVTLRGLQARAEMDAKVVRKGLPRALTRFSRFAQGWMSPARDYMDGSLRKAYQDMIRAFSARANHVNEILANAIRNQPQAGDLVRAVQDALPGAQKAWVDSVRGGTMENELFPRLVTAYLNPSVKQLQDNQINILREIVMTGAQKNETLAQIAQKVYEATREALKRQEGALVEQVAGDLIFAKIFATQVLFHQTLIDTLGLGAVLDTRSFEKVKAWTERSYKSSSGLDYILNVVKDPANLGPRIDWGELADSTMDVLQHLSLRTAEGATEKETRLAVARQRQFAEIAAENALDSSEKIVSENKPFVPRAAMRTINAAIDEALGTAQTGWEQADKAGNAFASVYKQALTVGIFEASMGAAHQIANFTGDFAMNLAKTGWVRSVRALRESLGTHLLLIPYLALGLTAVSGKPLPEALKMIRGAIGNTKMDKHMDAVFSLLSRHPEVPAILEGRRGEQYIDAMGRSWDHAALLEMAQRQGVPESFAVDQLKRVVSDYVRGLSVRNRPLKFILDRLAAMWDVPRDVGQIIGQQRRVGLMLSFLDEGYDLETAGKTVSEVFLNYRHDLHPLDRGIIMGILQPFFSFTKTNAARVLAIASSPSTWDGASLRLERSLDAGATALTQYATHDGRDEYGMCEADMTDAELQKWRKFREYLRSQGVSYQQFMHLVELGVASGQLDNDTRIARGVPAQHPHSWFLQMAQAYGYEGTEIDNLVWKYYIPDPSWASVSPLMEERTHMYFNLGRAEAGQILSQGRPDAWGMVAFPASPLRDPINLFAATWAMVHGAFLSVTEVFITGYRELLEPGTQPPNTKLEQAEDMFWDNSMRVLGHPERNPLVASGVNFISPRAALYQGQGVMVDEELARILPETWVDVKNKPMQLKDGTWVTITTWRVKPERQANVDALLMSGLATAMPLAMNVLAKKGNPLFKNYEGVDGVDLVPFFGLKPTVTSESAQADAATRNADEIIAERMGEADAGRVVKPPLSNFQIAQMERQLGENLYRIMPSGAKRQAMIRVIGAFKNAGSGQDVSYALPLARVALRVVGGLSEPDIDAMSQREVFDAVGALTPPQ